MSPKEKLLIDDGADMSANSRAFLIKKIKKESNQDLIDALKLFVFQYQGNGRDEREQRPEMIAARAALKKHEND